LNVTPIRQSCTWRFHRDFEIQFTGLHTGTHNFVIVRQAGPERGGDGGGVSRRVGLTRPKLPRSIRRFNEAHDFQPDPSFPIGKTVDLSRIAMQFLLA
jgi:hypothetical protein